MIRQHDQEKVDYKEALQSIANLEKIGDKNIKSAIAIANEVLKAYEGGGNNEN